MCPPSDSKIIDSIYDDLLKKIDPLLIGSDANKIVIREHIYSALEDARNRYRQALLRKGE